MTAPVIAGVGIHPFGRTAGASGLDQAVVAVRAALADAGLDWNQVEVVYGGSQAAGFADSLLPRMGLTGIEFVNVFNGCATGGSALISAIRAVKSGDYAVALAVGFDKHPRGAFNPDPGARGLPSWYGETGLMVTTQFFAAKIRRYMHLHGISELSLARVAEKAFLNGSVTPHSWRRTKVSIEEILTSPMVSDPLRKFMFCSPGEGAAALIVMSEQKARQLGVSGPRVRSAVVRTRPFGSFEVFAPMLEIERGDSATQVAARAAFEAAELGPEDVDVAQLQDTDSGAEIMHMAENGFCADGDQEAWLADGVTALTGRLPVNTDGGCLACGEPIGASGLRQVFENVMQLRGLAGRRQVNNARIAYSQVYGAPGLAGVVILEHSSS